MSLSIYNDLGTELNGLLDWEDTDENLLCMIHSYFDTTPILHGLNFWATYPGERDITHNFHQDCIHNFYFYLF